MFALRMYAEETSKRIHHSRGGEGLKAVRSEGVRSLGAAVYV